MSRVAPNRANSKGRRQLGKGSLDDHLHEQLSKILISLAHLLLRNGYGYSKINAVTKAAFVKAAAELHKETHKKRNIARIATLTGLTRLEVSRLLRSGAEASPGNVVQLNRAVRVAEGWVSDREFASFKNKPRRLPFSGPEGSFTKLVRKYSGDIPARAMAEEMRRLGMVSVDSGKTMRLVRSQISASRSTISSLRAMAPWVRFLTFRTENGASEQFRSKADFIRMSFDSLPQVRAAIREVETRRAAFIDGLLALTTGPSANNGYEISVSVALAATHPKRVARNKQ